MNEYTSSICFASSSSSSVRPSPTASRVGPDKVSSTSSVTETAIETNLRQKRGLPYMLIPFTYVDWTLLPQLFGQVYFQQQGIWLVFSITMFYRNSCI